MHMNGNQPHPSDYEDPLYSPPPDDPEPPDSDFEIEDSALLGAQGHTTYYKQKLRQGSERIWGRAYGYITSTKYGRQGDERFRSAYKRAPRRTLILSAAIIIVLLLLLFISIFRPSRVQRTIFLPKNPFCSKPDQATPVLSKKPQGMKIYGLVFYGRRQTVEILDCYLRQALVKNGGWLDEVHFLINTNNQEDKDWIGELLPKVPQYRGIYMDEDTDMRDFESVWRQGLQHSSDDLYIKFDDDLVYLSPTAVQELVTSILTHPESFVVLGNLIDAAALGWVHHHHNAIKSYLPEAEPPDKTSAGYGPKAWRDSALPTHPYTSDQPFFRDDEAYNDEPPYLNHRWLPLRDNDTLLPQTPIWKTGYDAYSFDWNHWQLGAQQHYSFLSHLEAGNLAAYHFGHRETGLWNMRFMHANINLMAVWANDILDNLPFNKAEDDEGHFSVTLPAQTKRQVYIQTRAIASHFSFGPQGGMYKTDLLGRYRAYANEHACKDMGIKIKPREKWLVAEQG